MYQGRIRGIHVGGSAQSFLQGTILGASQHFPNFLHKNEIFQWQRRFKWTPRPHPIPLPHTEPKLHIHMELTHISLNTQVIQKQSIRRRTSNADQSQVLDKYLFIFLHVRILLNIFLRDQNKNIQKLFLQSRIRLGVFEILHLYWYLNSCFLSQQERKIAQYNSGLLYKILTSE